MPGRRKTINWPLKVEELKARVGADWMHPEVGQYLETIRGQSLLVACSGGADSVYMLCLLAGLADAMELKLVVAHYNHRWRGLASNADAGFVDQLAGELGLSIEHGFRPPKEAAFTETTARALRLGFLREVAEKRNCPAIALGHQQDDILETQLIRLSRGAGADGLAAPRPISRFDLWATHIRPLLELSATSIREDLTAVGIPWCEDSSNTDLTIARNALRQEIIPRLSEALAHDVFGGSARSRKLLEEDAAALDVLARERFPKAFSMSDRLDRHRLRLAPKAITRRALLAWLSDHDLLGSVSAHAMDLILEAVYDCKQANRFSVGVNYLVLDADHLAIEWTELDARVELEPTVIAPGDSALLSTGAQLSSRAVELDTALSARILAGQIDQHQEAYLSLKPWENLEIRSWLPGDRFSPIGAPGRKKVKDWFIDRHIPRKERKQLPLVVDEFGEILWIPGFPPAETHKITPNTKLALRLTYQNRDPL